MMVSAEENLKVENIKNKTICDDKRTTDAIWRYTCKKRKNRKYNDYVFRACQGIMKRNDKLV
jgi:hypothetical protein